KTSTGRSLALSGADLPQGGVVLSRDAINLPDDVWAHLGGKLPDLATERDDPRQWTAQPSLGTITTGRQKQAAYQGQGDQAKSCRSGRCRRIPIPAARS